MTTSCVQIRTFIFTATLLVGLCVLTNTALAENNILASSSEGIVVSEISSLPEVKAPWFRIEKLTGDNLAMGDFVVGPGRAEVEVKPGQTVVYEVSVANRISDNRTFELYVEDVTGSLDADSAVTLMGDKVGPYSVKSFISFPEKTFSLNLGERARIPVTITIPPDADPGGYYGSVLVSTIKTDANEDEEQIVRAPVIARIGTLFFITVPGEVERSGVVKELSLIDKSWWYEKGPIDFNILTENTGSVHLNPYGELRIKNLFGEEVGFVELEPWFVLPKSLRSRDISWDRELLFGRYTATALINRGYDDIVDEHSVAFWVLPWKPVGGIFLVVFIIMLGFRLFFRTFEFKRKT